MSHPFCRTGQEAIKQMSDDTASRDQARYHKKAILVLVGRSPAEWK